MSIEVKIDSQTNACNICFTCSDEITHVGDLGVIFRILLKDSPIEMTETYLESMEACENCSVALRNISNVRDALIYTIALENTMKQEIEYDNQLKEEVDALLCSICGTSSQEVSLSDLSETIEMLIQDSSVELTEKALREMMCCVNCHTKLENIAQFQSAIVEEQLNMLISTDEEKDISMLSPSQIKEIKEDEEVSDNQDSSYSPAKEDLDTEQTSTEDEENTPIRKDQKGGETHDTGLRRKRLMTKQTYCPDCNVEFKSPKYFREHLYKTLKHAVKNHHCHLCKKTFFRLHELNDHIKCDHFGKPYSCAVCNKSFRLKRVLALHVKKCEPTENSSAKDQTKHKPTSNEAFCKDCNMAFKSPAYLKRHLLYTLKHAVKKLQCEFCTKRYFRHDDLKVHIQFEHEGKGYTCSICENLFRFKRDLIRHIESGHPEVETPGPYQCKDCGTLFFDKSDYKAHRINIHGAGDEFAYCVQCNKEFESKEKLNSHIKFSMQHGGKRFKCSQCDKSFHFKRLLEGHISFAHDNKGHQCPICKKVYPPPYGLSKHLRNVYKVRPRVCKICNKVLCNKSALELHMELHPL